MQGPLDRKGVGFLCLAVSVELLDGFPSGHITDGTGRAAKAYITVDH
jgi:hypothetical protein